MQRISMMLHLRLRLTVKDTNKKQRQVRLALHIMHL